MIEVQNESLLSRSPESLYLGESVRRELSSFERRALELNGALELFERLSCGSLLDVTQIRTLCDDTPLPVLAKLSSLMSPGVEVCRLQPVFLLPVAEASERCPRVELAVAELLSLLSKYDKDVSSEYPIAITLDRWRGSFKTERLFEVLLRLNDSLPGLRNQYFLFGPSSRDLQILASGGELSRPQIFNFLQTLGVTRIEGGADVEIREQAFSFGIGISLGQEIVAVSSGKRGSRFSESFIEDLLNVRGGAEGYRGIDVWFPWSRKLVDNTLNESEPLATQMLKAVAVGRLVLRNIPIIRAPISVFGLHCACLAAYFGANDLGFIALDEVTAKELNLLRHSDVVKFLNFSGARVNLSSKRGVK